jgi:hypothetical protein
MKLNGKIHFLLVGISRSMLIVIVISFKMKQNAQFFIIECRENYGNLFEIF